MNKKIAFIIVIIIIILGIWMFWVKPSTVNAPVSENVPPASPTLATKPMTSTGELFATSKYFSKAYEVYPNPDPQNGARVLSGFSVQIDDLGNGLSRVTLVAKQSNYKTQSVVLSVGQKLYFYERSLGDDSNDQDLNYGDDMGIAVDANGYIMQ